MKKVFFISAAVIFVVLVSSCVFLYRLGDKVIEMSLEAAIQSELEKATEDIDREIEIQDQLIEENMQTTDTSNNQAASIPKQDEQKSQGKNSEADVTKISSGQQGKQNETVHIKDSKTNNNKGSNEIKLPETKPAGKVIPVQKVKEIKDNITLTEKVKVSMILLDKLKVEDMNELKGMLQGGVTEGEKKRAKEIVYSRLTDKEINEIKDIYEKYMYY